jgi:cobalt-zinc-cadmium efflux system protein
MAHNHSHHHDHTDVKNIQTAFFLNLAFTIIEIIGGFFTNSIAILSDALHDLGDSLSLGVSWYLQRVSKKGATKNFTYGFRRFSLLGALINAVILISGSIFIMGETVKRFQNPEPADAKGMILLAVIGVIFNGAAVLKLQKGASINEKVVSLHLLEDVLGWVAVLIGSIIMYFFNLPIIDPILSLLISVYVLYNAFNSLKSTMKVLLQAIPENTNVDKIKAYFGKLPEIQNFHDLHLWSMDGTYNILTVHLVKNARVTSSELKEKIRHDLEHLGVNHVTIELEEPGEYCEVDC